MVRKMEEHGRGTDGSVPALSATFSACFAREIAAVTPNVHTLVKGVDIWSDSSDAATEKSPVCCLV